MQLASSSKAISESVEHYIQAAEDLQGAIRSQAANFSTTQAEQISVVSNQLDNQLQSFRQQFQGLAAGDEEEDNLFDGLQQELESAHSAFEEELAHWGEGVKETVQRSCREASTAVTQQNTDIGKAVDSLQAALDNIVQQARNFVQDQRQLLAEMKEYSNSQAASEIARLKKQNQMLNQVVANERNRANAAKDDLVQRVTGLLDTFLQERDESLKSAARELQRENDGLANATKAEAAKYGKTCEAAEGRIQAYDGRLQQGIRENKRKREEVSKVCAIMIPRFDCSLIIPFRPSKILRTLWRRLSEASARQWKSKRKHALRRLGECTKSCTMFISMVSPLVSSKHSMQLTFC